MLLKFALFISFTLVLGKNDHPLENLEDIKQLNKCYRGFGEAFKEWRSKVKEAISETINEEKQSLSTALRAFKEAAKNTAAVTKDVAKAGIEVVQTIPQVLHHDEKLSFKDRLKNAYHKTKNLVKNSFKKIKEVTVNNTINGIIIAKAGWDLGTVFPKIGINIFGEPESKLQAELIQNYENKKKIVSNSVKSMDAAGNRLKNVGIELNRSVEDFRKELEELKFANSDVRVSRVNYEDLEISNSLMLVKKAGNELNNAGDNVIQASTDLVNLISKYALKELTEEDKNNIKAAIFKKVDEIISTVGGVTSSINIGLDNMNFVTENLINTIKKQLQTNSDYRFLRNSQTLIYKTARNNKEVAKIIAKSGKDISYAAQQLKSTVPHFGFGLLSRENQILDQSLLKPFEVQKDIVITTLDFVQKAGELIEGYGKNSIHNLYKLKTRL